MKTIRLPFEFDLPEVENCIIAYGMPLDGDETDLLIIPFEEIVEIRNPKPGEDLVGENVNHIVEVETTEGPQTYVFSSYAVVGDMKLWAMNSGNSLLIG